jgi:hypothetical protein
MKHAGKLGWVALGGLALLPHGLAAAPPTARVVVGVLGCRQIAEEHQRLACFDQQSALLAAATAKGDVAILDQENVRQARTQNFGRSVAKPILPLGGKDVDEINVDVRSASIGRDGGWLLVMSDGSTWSQTDDVILGRSPKAGSKARIFRAAMGSFKISVDRGPAFKSRRIR